MKFYNIKLEILNETRINYINIYLCENYYKLEIYYLYFKNK